MSKFYIGFITSNESNSVAEYLASRSVKIAQYNAIYIPSLSLYYARTKHNQISMHNLSI